MAGFNGRGPFGYGPGTGWGRGPCMGGGFRLGRGLRRGRGWGWGDPFVPEITKEEEKELLKEGVDFLEEELKAIKKRLSELKDK